MPSAPTGKHGSGQTHCVFWLDGHLTGTIRLWQGGFHRRNEILLRPVVLFRPVEGENASGHGGQEEREAQAAGGRALCPPYCPFMCFSGCVFFLSRLFFSLHLCPIIRLFQEQKRCMESSTLQREVKKVRKARNRRQEWNMMAFDKELRPDHRHPQTLRRGASSEGSLSPDGRSGLLFQTREEQKNRKLTFKLYFFYHLPFIYQLDLCSFHFCFV